MHLQARNLVLRKLCGLGPMPVSEKPDISRTNMEFLKLELERLSTEKVGQNLEGCSLRMQGRHCA